MAERSAPDISMADRSIDELMETINISNRKRKSTGEDSPLLQHVYHNKKKDVGGGRDTVGDDYTDGRNECEGDYIHYGTGQNLPWLPYAFWLTCAFCGKTGIPPDPRRAMPLKFLADYLKFGCARTPWVYNTLYQMAHNPQLEIEVISLCGMGYCAIMVYNHSVYSI